MSSPWWLNMPRTVCLGGCGGWSWECMCHLYADPQCDAYANAQEQVEREHWEEMQRLEEQDWQNDYELNGVGFDRIAMGM